MEAGIATRPTGRVQTICAMYCAAIAAMLIIAGLLLPVERYGDIVVRNISLRFWLYVVSGGLLQAALLCWLAATIVQALSFLPRSGEEIPQSKLDSGDALLMFALLSTFGVILYNPRLGCRLSSKSQQPRCWSHLIGRSRTRPTPDA
jgi:hypothetical protein